MLIEIWERLRGYDKWVEATATVERVDVIMWTDNRGEKQYAGIDGYKTRKTPRLVAGDTVQIRYSPACPEGFYYRDLLRAKVRKSVRSTLLILLFLVFTGLRIWITALIHRK
jgi:hypothetical protein